MLAVTLQRLQGAAHLFCKTPSCPVVYFSIEVGQNFTQEEVRERVYQKEPDADEVFICYCCKHTAGDIRLASRAMRNYILDGINSGIKAERCACDLRNPQGSCCLGNVRGLIKSLEHTNHTASQV
jgi:hypothetical protein